MLMMDRRAFLKGTRRAASPPAFPEPKPLAINAGLEPHTAALTRASAVHLLRRTWFSAPAGHRAVYIGQRANEAAASLVERAQQAPLPEPPFWVDRAEPPRDASDNIKAIYRRDSDKWLEEWQDAWVHEMLAADLLAPYRGTTSGDNLREKMALFWHNHFVTEVRDYKLAVYAYRYVTLLRTHALGNFKDFVYAMGTDPAMLTYLNGAQSVVGNPNENYPRELLELFTMGEFDQQGNPNYTQQDVEEVARALTGWTINRENIEAEFVAERHDAGQKTIFGRTGPFDYDGLIDLLFEERGPQIATFICRKLYKAFVYAAPDDAIVAELADLFIDNDFEIAPVVETLLCSSHFFDTQVAGAQIKDPLTFLISFVRDLNATEAVPDADTTARMRDAAARLGQDLLNPPNVGGWPGHRTWLTTNNLPLRWLSVDRVMRYMRVYDQLDMFQLAESVHDSDDRMAVFNLPVALAQHFLGIQVEELDILIPADDFGGDLQQNPMPESIVNGPPHVLNLTKVFLAGTPWYEWSPYNDGAPALIFNYILALNQAPDFQLT